ncbi:DUF222 domain-containing protein [Cellulomonas sp. ATA003]|uniref:DUF222 domain-containing protein n=1 Tax=Cellulomonas sp. ATA003 TaxID=3073064 RepID=UPI002872C60F|nr:DUF222 domain-containing protein [Cellulomonas sp. ATA003]WNB84580.1 DUF222 domain-containing protein [Cellulomonas sp. ATA003]
MTSAIVPPPGSPGDDDVALSSRVAAALSAMDSAVSELAGLELAELEGREAAVVARRLAELTSRAAVAKVRLLPVIDDDGVWALSGARSFPVWLSHDHRLSVSAARAQVRLGRTLRDHLPMTAAAAVAGEVTVEQAQVIASLAPTSEQRREVLADPEQVCNEALIVDQAQRLSVDETRVFVRHWAAYADPDADDRGYVASYDRERLDIARLGDGYRLEGLLTVEHGQALKAALAAVTPVPAADDDRPSTQRRAHALGDLAQVVLDNGLAGTGRAVRPQVTVLVDYPTLAALVAAGDAKPQQGTLLDRDGDGDTSDDGDADNGDQGGDGGQRCTEGPVRTAPMLSTAMLTGRTLAGGPQYEDRTPIPRKLLDRIACDGGLNRILFGPDSEVLDVGRTERTFTRARRAAIIARDKHCRYPTCTAPPIICQAHHVEQWARDGGKTSVDNGILLCSFHHRIVHDRDIAIRRHHGRWEFTDRHGTTIDPDRDRPLAAHLRRHRET